MKIKHVMTKDPTCCVPSDTAQRAARIMRDEHAGVVPVIDNEQGRKVTGVVTDRDLCMNVIAEGRDRARCRSRTA
jgi:CBS domain-containing protein